MKKQHRTQLLSLLPPILFPEQLDWAVSEYAKTNLSSEEQAIVVLTELSSEMTTNALKPYLDEYVLLLRQCEYSVNRQDGSGFCV